VLEKTNLHSGCNFRYVIAYVLFASALEWNFGAHDAHEYTNLVLLLVNFVRVPAARQPRVNFTTIIRFRHDGSNNQDTGTLLDAFHGGTCNNVPPLLKKERDAIGKPKDIYALQSHANSTDC